jgi:alkylhydroperoxidase family enzyme
MRPGEHNTNRVPSEKIPRANGYARYVRFSEWLNRQRLQRTMTLQGTEYFKEANARQAIELTVSQINSGAAGERDGAKFGAIITLYRRKFLPSESGLLDLKKTLRKVFPANGALVDAFTVAREDEFEEIDLILRAAATLKTSNYCVNVWLCRTRRTLNSRLANITPAQSLH